MDLLNSDGGSTSTVADSNSITYNFNAQEDWLLGTDTQATIVSATNGITVSNYQAPTVTSAIYDYSSGILVVTGTYFDRLVGVNNDIAMFPLYK